MLHRKRFAPLAFFVGLVAVSLISGRLQAGIFRGHWYSDPCFSSSYSGQFHSHAMPCSSVYVQPDPKSIVGPTPEMVIPHSVTPGAILISGSNRSATLCPPPSNAILQLWVPDSLRVEINGYATKPQRLAGIHRHSRVYSLEGLDAHRYGACNIVVYQPNNRKVIRYHHGLSVRSGEHYEARFPNDFHRIVAPAPVVQPCARRTRVQSNLEVLYDFKEGRDKHITDQSKEGGPLTLEMRRGTQWVPPNALVIPSNAKIESDAPAKTLIQAVKESREITIEAWLHTDKTHQSGPARIVTLSKGASNRNITLGQHGDKFQVRIRTAAKPRNLNGLQGNELESHSGSVKDKQMHVVYTRNKDGMATLYLDGKQVASNTVLGGFENWDDNYHLTLANESTDKRPWLGTYYLVAIYSRALSAKEVKRNHRARF